MPCDSHYHSVLRTNKQRFYAEAVGPDRIQKDFDDVPLLVIRLCPYCDTSLSRPASIEAATRLKETHAETVSRTEAIQK